MTVTYYHNPNCSTSRNALALLRERGVEPTIVEYLKTPLTRTELAELLRRLDLPPRALIRTRGDLYAGTGTRRRYLERRGVAGHAGRAPGADGTAGRGQREGRADRPADGARARDPVIA
jgi:hypothetical protein